MLAADDVALGDAPTLREVIRLMRVTVALYCSSYDKPPAAVTLDIDDTLDVVHGQQQLSMFNAHYDERCFLPIHKRFPAWPSAGRYGYGMSFQGGDRLAALRESDSRRHFFACPNQRLSV